MKLQFFIFVTDEAALWANFETEGYYTQDYEAALCHDTAADAMGYYLETMQYLIDGPARTSYEIVEAYRDDSGNWCARFLDDHEHDHAIEQYFEDQAA